MKININLSFLIFFLLLARGVVLSQPTPQKFFNALIYDKAEITDYVNKDELAKSERLGITYTDVKNKFMLGYELPDEIKDGIKSGKYKYEVKEQSLADAYSQVTFSVPEANFGKVYYFNNGFVSNSTYFTEGWQKKESKYFNFSLEEPKYFNDYCVKRLDDFVDMIADTLGYTISEKRMLEKEKLGYIFCADEKGVEKITGFNAKGLAMLGTDEVVTSYQTHFHEVAHLLINYKIKTLGLYTLPFFMEGFAVAVGGRGGMVPRVVTDLGCYLQKTGELTYDSIFTFDQFRNMDGSMTYPVSGLYNSFLLSELGSYKYLELYKKVNGDLEYVKNINLNSLNLPVGTKWDSYLEDYKNNPNIYFDANDTNTLNNGGNMGSIDVLNNGNIKFSIPEYMFIGFLENNVSTTNYTSKLFITMFPEDSINLKFLTEYGIFVDSISVKIVNFYNDEIVVNYYKELSSENQKVPERKNRYEFFVKASILNQNQRIDYVINGIILKSYYHK